MTEGFSLLVDFPEDGLLGVSVIARFGFLLCHCFGMTLLPWVACMALVSLPCFLDGLSSGNTGGWAALHLPFVETDLANGARGGPVSLLVAFPGLSCNPSN